MRVQLELPLRWGIEPLAQSLPDEPMAPWDGAAVGAVVDLADVPPGLWDDKGGRRLPGRGLEVVRSRALN